MNSIQASIARALAFTLAFALPAVFAACNTGNKSIGTVSLPCSASSDCPADHLCEDQTCQPCEGSACAGEEGQSCVITGDCPPGQTCSRGACELCEAPDCIIEEGLSCTVDADCSADQVCISGQCQIEEQACLPEPEECDGLDNDCDGDVDEGAICPGGGTCILGRCAFPPDQCQMDTDCPPGQLCNRGQCEPQG